MREGWSQWPPNLLGYANGQPCNILFSCVRACKDIRVVLCLCIGLSHTCLWVREKPIADHYQATRTTIRAPVVTMNRGQTDIIMVLTYSQVVAVGRMVGVPISSVRRPPTFTCAWRNDRAQPADPPRSVCRWRQARARHEKRHLCPSRKNVAFVS